MQIATDVLSGLLVFVFGGAAAGKLLGAKSQVQTAERLHIGWLHLAGIATDVSGSSRRLRPSACSPGSGRRRWAPPLPSASYC
jgi:hypothetical protein